MTYTVKELANLSGVSVRTLHYYDEIGLLKPAYYAENGYRAYEEKQLLIMQQILFFREMGMELKKIKELLEKGDFDKIGALVSHKSVLQKQIEKNQLLIQTIDRTIQHIKGERQIEGQELYWGFNRNKQRVQDKYLKDNFGMEIEHHIDASYRKVHNWDSEKWDEVRYEFDSLIEELVELAENGLSPESTEAQSAVEKHYKWLSHFWSPGKEAYIGHSQLILERDLSEAYNKHFQGLAAWFSDAIAIYAWENLS